MAISTTTSLTRQNVHTDPGFVNCKMMSYPDGMPARRILPSDSTLAKWREEGLTYQQICARIEEQTGEKVNPPTIGAALSRAGLTDRVRYSDALPWDNIKTQHNNHYAASMLRAWARRKRNLPLTAEQEARLDSWLARLKQEDAIVVYRPNSPDGFYYVPRKLGERGPARVSKGTDRQAG